MRIRQYYFEIYSLIVVLVPPYIIIWPPIVLLIKKILWYLCCRWVSSGVVGSQAFAAYDQGMQIELSHVHPNIILLVMCQSKYQSQHGEMILIQNWKVA